MTEEVSDKTAAHFLSMHKMLKCIRFYIEFFKHEKIYSASAKHLNNKLDNSIRIYQNDIGRMFKDEHRKIWHDDLTEKDFAYASNILDFCTNFNDDQKYALELFCQELKNGTVRIEEENING